jgi:beta-glucanase (GH16 family)
MTRLALPTLVLSASCLTPAPPAPASAGEASAAATLSRAGHTFRPSFEESFDHGPGPAELGDWTFAGNAARFEPSNVDTSGGTLTLSLTKNQGPHGERAFSGAEYARPEAQLFGRFVARMKPASPPGVITSFFTAFYDFDAAWTMRETAEIDIEFVGTTRAVEFAIHWMDEAGQHQQRSQRVELGFDAKDAFHDWEIEWLPERVSFYVDGRELHRFSDPAQLAELRHPQQPRVNLWISSEADWAGPFSEQSLPVQAAYQWIRSYELVQ